MSFAPYKDRTITLIDENTYRRRAGSALLSAAQDLTARYLPAQGRNFFGGKTIGNSAQALLGSPDTSKDVFVTLKGPTKIAIIHKTGVAEEEGLFSSFIQPWFVQNIDITISGSSYIGAFPLLSSPDGDAKNLISSLYTTLNDFSGIAGPEGSKSRLVLTLRGNPDKAKSFIGYIKQLDLTEAVESAYLIDYTLSFVGRNIDNMAITDAKRKARAAETRSSGQESPFTWGRRGR